MAKDKKKKFDAEEAVEDLMQMESEEDPECEEAEEDTELDDEYFEQDDESAKLLKEKEDKLNELNDKYKRLFAEFDNFRKRSESEKSTKFTDGEMVVLNKVLPLIDNFERAIANEPEDLKDNAYVDGVRKTYRSFMDALASMGVTPIEAIGKPFDANLHNAVMHVEDDETDENTIVDEFQKGYMLGDKVLRYSMVKVAN